MFAVRIILAFRPTAAKLRVERGQSLRSKLCLKSIAPESLVLRSSVLLPASSPPRRCASSGHPVYFIGVVHCQQQTPPDSSSASF
ncbi:hypothetical protein PGTUg99_012927 [Puccinia graminis f. sp. tritici]|uniref:Uncharacterized protein n=1 Tax=Puccinia graminis f. sp. tritici TaxID=56615 RepID=A0A5B0R586_PUCGR|nr:hypothetical protein PGTUg99_012927 [Puccinia graminis f. sp. tritici]